MICPKCKKTIPEKSLKCSHCGARIASLCKKCNAYNSIYNLNCVNCNEELLKLCSSCKSVNFPNAMACRKCGHSFLQTKTIEETLEQTQMEENIEAPEAVEVEPQLSYSANFHTQQKAKEIIIQGITSTDKKIISLSGEKGIGKTIVLKAAINTLSAYKITWLFGECNAITQLSPCGLIQDILLTFFNVANFCSDSLKLKKESQKFFQNEFPTLTNEEIFNLLNFLYPTNTDYYENILKNKQKTFTFLEKVFNTLAERSEAVIVIDNFDMIDGLSYEFLHNLINSKTIKNLKFLMTYNELRPARGYLYSQNLKDDAYLDISLKAFDKSQVETFISQYIPAPKVCPDNLKVQIFKNSAGIPTNLEQIVSLVVDFEKKNNSFAIDLPTSFNEIIKTRLDYLKLDNTDAYHILAAATIQGTKFYPSIINQIFNLAENEFADIINMLQERNFIMPINEFAYAFKNSTLWTSILDVIKEDELFVPLNEKLFSVYSTYTLSSNSIMAIISQNLNQKLSALNIWTENIKLASYIGDTNLYAISQKQCLVLADQLEGINSTLIKNNIYERLGKLLAKTNPDEAMTYLPSAIANAQKLENPLKEIELTGYLASCTIALGDYYATVECIDAVIARIDYEFDLEIAMLKSRKLDALLNIGNSGQIVNLVDNEILPIFEKYINAKPHKNISIKSLYVTWLRTYLYLANALVLQGDNRAFEVLSTLFDLIKKNEFNDQLFICKAKLALAFAYTIKGDIESSENILEDIITLYKTDIMDNEAISRWNLINILNNFIHKKYTNLKEELFQVVTFANNINDNFTKNILKTLLGKMFKDEENAKQALSIYSEQITYFAKEKNAIGALLSWYLIAEADLIVDGPEKSLEVALKALEVAQNPKINNYVFIILYNKIIAEAYMSKSDYEAAKIHIEKAILVARKFELLDMLAKLYLLYGKYLQDIALIRTDAQVDYVLGASKMYKKANLIAEKLKNTYLLAKIEKSKTVLNSFCQLNGITLKD